MTNLMKASDLAEQAIDIRAMDPERISLSLDLDTLTRLALERVRLEARVEELLRANNALVEKNRAQGRQIRAIEVYHQAVVAALETDDAVTDLNS